MLTGSVKRSHGPGCREMLISIHSFATVDSVQSLQRRGDGDVPTGVGHFLPRRDILTDGGSDAGCCEGWRMDELDFCWVGGR